MLTFRKATIWMFLAAQALGAPVFGGQGAGGLSQIAGPSQTGGHSQSHDPSGVIGGRVTIEGKPAQDVTVMVTIDDGSAAGRAATDEDGRFRITGLRAASYRVKAFAPGFFAKGFDGYGQTISLNEGEIVDGLSFALGRAGVITGRVTDRSGNPLVEQAITVGRLTSEDSGSIEFPSLDFETDDRGVYRIYGLAPGRYIVSVGCDDQEASWMGRCYQRTYHPGVTDPKKATVVQVSAGGEVSGADITLGDQKLGFKAIGRVVDDRGRALSGVWLRYGRLDEDGEMINGPGSHREWITGRDGQFQLDNVAPGNYWLSTVRDPTDTFYSDLLKFEVGQSDVTGLLLTVHTGGSVSGTVTLDGEASPQARAQFWSLSVSAAEVYADDQDYPDIMPAPLGPDGSFQISGIMPGKVSIQPSGQASRLFRLVRIERDGIVQEGPIELNPGESLTGLRLLVRYETGVLNGQVVVPQGTPRPLTRFVIFAVSRDHPDDRRYALADSRGHFSFEGLSEGQYDVNLLVTGADGRPIPQPKQTATVTGDAPATITLTYQVTPAQ